MSEPVSWLRALRAAAIRAALVAASLMAMGALVYRLALGDQLGSEVLLSELAFDACLGAFVAGPAALLERRWSDAPREPGALWLPILAIAVLAFLGTTLAFLQAHYTSATLRSGSLEDGLAALLDAATWLGRYRDLAALFALIAVMFASVSGARLFELGLGGQLVATLLAVLPLGVAVLTLSGLGGLGLAISLSCLAFASCLLPALAHAGDRLEARMFPHVP